VSAYFLRCCLGCNLIMSRFRGRGGVVWVLSSYAKSGRRKE
jgi:hypothetical protein